jgi:hypothetical protein
MKIRSVLESSCVVFFSMMKENDWEMIERPIKILLKILQGPNHTDFETGLATYSHLGITSMRDRLRKLSLSWALKASQDAKFFSMLPVNPRGPYHLRSQELFTVPFAHTERYRNSPLVALPRLLNEYVADLPADVLDLPAAGLLLPPAVAAHLELLRAPPPTLRLQAPQDPG